MEKVAVGVQKPQYHWNGWM